MFETVYYESQFVHGVVVQYETCFSFVSMHMELFRNHRAACNAHVEGDRVEGLSYRSYMSDHAVHGFCRVGRDLVPACVFPASVVCPGFMWDSNQFVVGRGRC